MNVWAIGGGLAGALIGSLVTKGKAKAIGVIGGGGLGAAAGYFGGRYMEGQLPSGPTTTPEVTQLPDITPAETVSPLPAGKGVSQEPSLALPSGKTATSSSGSNWGSASNTKSGGYVPINEVEGEGGGNIIADQIEVLLDRTGIPGHAEDYMSILSDFSLRRN